MEDLHPHGYFCGEGWLSHLQKAPPNLLSFMMPFRDGLIIHTVQGLNDQDVIIRSSPLRGEGRVRSQGFNSDFTVARAQKLTFCGKYSEKIELCNSEWKI